MKKLLLILACTFAAFGTVRAVDKPIEITQLPRQAQQFIKGYFAKEKVSMVTMDTELADKSYDVIFADGTRVEFDKNGAWKEVKCKERPIPSSIIPEAIRKYVRDHFPVEKIIEIDRDKQGYDVKLSNGLQFEFDNKFRITEIDD